MTRAGTRPIDSAAGPVAGSNSPLASVKPAAVHPIEQPDNPADPLSAGGGSAVIPEPATSRPRLLDLFCGAGGAAMGYHRAGFEVVGVDINPQPHYPFEFHQADALTYPLDGYDAIHASPPCQFYTRKAADWGRKRNHWTDHPDLLAPTRERLTRAGVPYVIENVEGAPLDAQIMLCGTMFPPPGTTGKVLIKERLFEANWRLPMPPMACNHGLDIYNPWSGKARSADKLRDAQGTPWIPMSGGASRKAGVTGDLFNAIPPAYTEWIGAQLMRVVAAR